MRVRARNKGEDLTIIPGLAPFAERALRARGIVTLEQLRTADLGWLPEPIRAAIERWRDE